MKLPPVQTHRSATTRKAQSDDIQPESNALSAMWNIGKNTIYADDIPHKSRNAYNHSSHAGEIYNYVERFR